MATLSPTTWITMVTTAPGAAVDATNGHTYAYERNTRVLGVEVRNKLDTDYGIADCEFEIFVYSTGSLPTWFGRVDFSVDQGPTVKTFDIPMSYDYIYIRQTEEYNSVGTLKTDSNPPIDYRIILDTKN